MLALFFPGHQSLRSSCKGGGLSRLGRPTYLLSGTCDFEDFTSPDGVSTVGRNFRWGGKWTTASGVVYIYRGLKISEAFLNVKLQAARRFLLFPRGLLAFFTERLSQLSLLHKVWGQWREGPSFKPQVVHVALCREGDSVPVGAGSAPYLPELGDRPWLSQEKLSLQLEKWPNPSKYSKHIFCQQ